MPCGDDARSGQECIEALLRSHPDLTAVTTINETALPGIQGALADTGLQVPYEAVAAGGGRNVLAGRPIGHRL
jgi:ABC-type sugar transport system substrate-binding protein